MCGYSLTYLATKSLFFGKLLWCFWSQPAPACLLRLLSRLLLVQSDVEAKAWSEDLLLERD